MKRPGHPFERMAWGWWLGCLLWLCCQPGCDRPFPPRTLVERLRILGIKADPPETDPAGTVQLSALVTDPKGEGREIQYHFAACAVNVDYLASDILCPGVDGLDLPSDGPNATLSLPTLIAWLLDRGVPLEAATGQTQTDTLPLLVGLSVQAQEETTRAVKRITVRLRGDAERNRNPTLLGLSLDGQQMTELSSPVPVGSRVKLRPLLAADSRQIYRRPDEDFDRVEDHLFSWFSTAGEFADPRTILDVDPQGRPLEEDEFTVPDGPGLIQLWLVVRDGRFGEDWLTQLIDVTPSF
jgi:hypothetical protein